MATARLSIAIADLKQTRLLAWELHALVLELRQRDPQMAAKLERILDRWTAGLASEDPPPSS